jgi:prepilin-type processing-associated H-X9-DG protein
MGQNNVKRNQAYGMDTDWSGTNLGEGKVVCDGDAIYPEYLSDLKIYFCPSQVDEKPSAYLNCPGGGWCGASSPGGPSALIASRFDDRGYIMYMWMHEDFNVALTMDAIAWATAARVGSSAGPLGLTPGSNHIRHMCDNDLGYRTTEPTNNITDPDTYPLGCTQFGASGQSSRCDLTDGFPTRYEFPTAAAVDAILASSSVANSYIAYGELPPVRRGNAGGKFIYRLREGIERALITDINAASGSALAQTNLPVAWDSLGASPSGTGGQRFPHKPGGCNVLYMDGHVEFVRQPGKHPMSKRMVIWGPATGSLYS